MRVFAILALLVGLVLAGTAVYFASERFRNMEARLAQQRQVPAVDLVEIAVAVKDLRFGDVLAPEAVKFVKWPKEIAPKNGFTTQEALFGTTGTKPRAVVRAMEPGEPILATKITNFGELAGMSQRLQPGMRAFTLQVDVSTGVQGWISPGDRVDILWNGADEGELITKLIMQNLTLIAIDQQVEADRARATVARTVTIEATPEQVLVLEQGRRMGKLSLSLRGTQDVAETGEAQVGIETIVGVKEKPVEVKEEVAPTVRVRRGTEAQEVATPTEQQDQAPAKPAP